MTTADRAIAGMLPIDLNVVSTTSVEITKIIESVPPPAVVPVVNPEITTWIISLFHVIESWFAFLQELVLF
jgi:hypothetical protein